jgi:hypothetical protein
LTVTTPEDATKTARRTFPVAYILNLLKEPLALATNTISGFVNKKFVCRKS